MNVSVGQTVGFISQDAGIATGPPGRTNIQTLFDFERKSLPTVENPNKDGYYFSDSEHYNLSIVEGGPGESTKCLQIQQVTGAYKSKWVWRYFDLWWVGPRTGTGGYIKQCFRSNSHSLKIRAFDDLVGDERENFTIGGYAKQRTPHHMSHNEPESHNMHNYFQTKVDWGGGVWRELLVRSNPTHQRSDRHDGGYDLFMEYANLWADQTRFYYSLGAGNGDVGPGKVFIDDILWFYENPFMAAFPTVSTKWAMPGEVVVHSIRVWNTHASKTRRFNIKVGGTKGSGGVQWLLGWGATGVSVTDKFGNKVSTTGPLVPGEGFLFNVSFTVPEVDRNGEQQIDGNVGVILFSIIEDGSGIPNPYVYLKPGGRSFMDRYDLAGIGVIVKTIVWTTPKVIREPTGILDLTVQDVGGSWVDLAWTSPAANQNAAAYAIRYSHNPITDELSWHSAIPVEAVPAVFGEGIKQGYSIKGLNFATRYYAALRVYNDNYDGGSIASISFTTKPFDIDLGTGLTTSVSSKSAKRQARQVPNVPMLQSTYPNPFASSTSIVYSLPNSSSVTIKIYNVLGQIVRVLVADSVQNVGSHTLNWDGRDTSGSIVPSGTYYVKMISGDSFSRQKIVFLR